MYQILKLNKFLFHFVFISFFFFSFSVFFIKQSSAESLSLFVEEDKATRVFLYPGRVSLLSLPCSITKALLGSANDIKVKEDINPNELILLLKKWNSQSSNLILKCNDLLFLFNLIPSKSKHYDYVKVLGHIPQRHFKVKAKSLQKNLSPSTLKNLNFKDFKILKLLDFSLNKNWEDKK